ncbi:hypothetical protein ABPG72_011237 [Tetrahymena utriculariae]
MSFQQTSKQNRLNTSNLQNAKNQKSQEDGFFSEVQSLFVEIQKNIQIQNYGDCCNVEESNQIIQENEKLMKKIKNILQQEIARDKKNQNKGYILQCEKQLQMFQKKINASKSKIQELIRQQQQEAEDDEENGFLKEKQIMNDMDFILYEETLDQRKERMENAHRQMRAVHTIYQQIENITAQQSSQLKVIDGHIESTFSNSKDTNKELVRAKQNLDKKNKNNFNMLFILITVFVVMIIFIKYK